MCDSAREILVGLPEHGNDIYRRHQLVWQAVRDKVSHGHQYIWACQGERLATIRSLHFAGGSPSPVLDGPLQLDLVAAARQGQRLKSIDRRRLPEFVEQLLERHGFQAQTIAVKATGLALGSKLDRLSLRRLDITLPVAYLELCVAVRRNGLAALAWQQGMGRGKRFGFGMLRRPIFQKTAG